MELYATLNGEEGRVLGYGLRLTDQKLADRLGRAWTKCAFWTKLTVHPYNPSVGKPDEGYIDTTDVPGYFPSGRVLNADLKRLGY